MDNTQKRIAYLDALLKKWEYEYYVLGTPSVSDEVYDHIFEERKALDASTLKIGSDLSPDSHLSEWPHIIPLLSLDKVYDTLSLKKWMDKFSPTRFSIEPKIDGVSLSLVYEEGRLTRALTRGDGIKGLDVTANVQKIPSILHSLASPDTYVLRGEIFMAREDFQKQKQDTFYANPRNLASGMLRRLQLSFEEAKLLQFFSYQITRLSQDFPSHEEAWKFLESHQFSLPPYVHFCDSYEEMLPFIEEIRLQRQSLPFDIDGFVVKVSDTALQTSLGSTNHHPRWAMAYKFSPPTSLSEVLDITIQVGRTGKITPLAHLSPVLIQGSTVKKATLHNRSFIQAMEIGIGDMVSISKRGDIIPAIEKVIEKNGEIWAFPTHCPNCNSLLIEDGANEFCPNPNCSEKIQAKLLYFTKTLDMRGMGEQFIALVCENFDIRNPEDFWGIPLEDLQNYVGFGDKKIAQIREVLGKTPSETSFDTLLVAMGIPEVGPKVVELLIQNGYSSLDDWLSISKETLIPIKGLGEKITQRLCEVFTLDSPVLSSLNNLKHIGFSLQQKAQTTGVSDARPLQGTVWVLTGSFQHYKPREKAATLIRTLGGNTAPSVTGKTTHLLYGEEAGTKLSQARNHSQITLISEAQFLETYGEA